VTSTGADEARALRREPLSDQVFARLRDLILTGAIAAGQALPAERELALEYGVNRHAVREAVKRLQQSRLIEVFHGGRTRALDWRRTAGLDLVVDVPGTLDAVSVPGVLHDLDAADIAWWRLIVEGCGNLAYLLAFNSLVDGAIAMGQAPLDLRSDELLDVEAHRELADRILRRDAAGARRLAGELLGRSVPGESTAGAPHEARAAT